MTYQEMLDIAEGKSSGFSLPGGMSYEDMLRIAGGEDLSEEERKSLWEKFVAYWNQQVGPGVSTVQEGATRTEEGLASGSLLDVLKGQVTMGLGGLQTLAGAVTVPFGGVTYGLTALGGQPSVDVREHGILKPTPYSPQTVAALEAAGAPKEPIAQIGREFGVGLETGLVGSPVLAPALSETPAQTAWELTREQLKAGAAATYDLAIAFLPDLVGLGLVALGSKTIAPAVTAAKDITAAIPKIQAGRTTARAGLVDDFIKTWGVGAEDAAILKANPQQAFEFATGARKLTDLDKNLQGLLLRNETLSGKLQEVGDSLQQLARTVERQIPEAKIPVAALPEEEQAALRAVAEPGIAVPPPVPEGEAAWVEAFGPRPSLPEAPAIKPLPELVTPTEVETAVRRTKAFAEEPGLPTGRTDLPSRYEEIGTLLRPESSFPVGTPEQIGEDLGRLGKRLVDLESAEEKARALVNFFEDNPKYADAYKWVTAWLGRWGKERRGLGPAFPARDVQLTREMLGADLGAERAGVVDKAAQLAAPTVARVAEAGKPSFLEKIKTDVRSAFGGEGPPGAFRPGELQQITEFMEQKGPTPRWLEDFFRGRPAPSSEEELKQVARGILESTAGGDPSLVNDFAVGKLALRLRDEFYPPAESFLTQWRGRMGVQETKPVAMTATPSVIPIKEGGGAIPAGRGPSAILEESWRGNLESRQFLAIKAQEVGDYGEVVKQLSGAYVNVPLTEAATRENLLKQVTGAVELWLSQPGLKGAARTAVKQKLATLLRGADLGNETDYLIETLSRRVYEGEPKSLLDVLQKPVARELLPEAPPPVPEAQAKSILTSLLPEEQAGRRLMAEGVEPPYLLESAAGPFTQGTQTLTKEGQRFWKEFLEGSRSAEAVKSMLDKGQLPADVAALIKEIQVGMPGLATVKALEEFRSTGGLQFPQEFLRKWGAGALKQEKPFLTMVSENLTPSVLPSKPAAALPLETAPKAMPSAEQLTQGPQAQMLTEALRPATETFMDLADMMGKRGLLKNPEELATYGAYLRRIYALPEAQRREAIDLLQKSGIKIVSNKGKMDLSETLHRHWDQVPREVQEKLGLVLDPRPRIAKGVATEISDMARHDLFKEWGNDLNYAVSDRTLPGVSATELKAQARARFGSTPQLVPDDPRYGDLAGAWTSQEIYDAVLSTTKIPTEVSKVSQTLTSLWKLGKVVFDPFVVSANMASNLHTANVIGEVPYSAWKYWSLGARRAAGKAFEGESIAQTAGRATAKGTFINEVEGAVQAAEGTANPVVSLTQNLTNLFGKWGKETGFSPTQFYQFLENWGKETVTAYQMGEKLKSPLEAMNIADRALQNYRAEFIAGGVQTLRSVPGLLPLATYTTSLMPRYVAQVLTDPAAALRLIKQAAPLQAVNYFGRKALKDEYGLTDKEIDEGLPKYMHKWSTIVIPTGEGAFAAVDVARLTPVAPLLDLVADTEEEGGLLGKLNRATLVPPGSPIVSIPAVAMTGKAPFAGYDVMRKGDFEKSWGENLLTYAYRQLAPGLAPGGYRWKQVSEGLAQQLLAPENRDKPDLLMLLARGVTGATVSPVSGETIQGQIDVKLRKMLRQIEDKRSSFYSRLRQIERTHYIIESQRQKDIDKLEQDFTRSVEEDLEQIKKVEGR